MMQVDLKTIVLLALVLFMALSGRDVTPTPGPTPDPGPNPVVDDAPFPADGLHVLIVEETTERQNLSAGHREVMTSVRLREWFDEHDVEWRLYDQHTELSGMTPTFQAAFKLPRDSLPYILISNGTKGFVGPLPDGVDATIQLVGKYE